MMPILIVMGCALPVVLVFCGVLFMFTRKDRAIKRVEELRQSGPKSNLNTAPRPGETESEAVNRVTAASQTVYGNGGPKMVEAPRSGKKQKVRPYISKSEYGRIDLRVMKGSLPIEGMNGEKLTMTDLNAHALVLGQSGTGKTRRFLTQIILSYFKGTHLPPGPDRERLKFAGFFLDPKAEFVNFVWAAAKMFGREKDVIFFGPTHLDNPIDPFGDPEELPLQRANKMLAIVKAANEGQKGVDPFWDNSAEKLFLNLFLLHDHCFKVYPDEAQPMSFTLLNLLLTDKGQAMNIGEISNYEGKRTEYFLQFDRASRELVSQIIRMLPDLERTSRQILAQQAEIERDPNPKAEERIAISSIKRLFEGVRSSQMVDIEGEMMSMEVEGGRLIMQLNNIKIAASQYTITNDDRERMHYEHTLVRSGADLRDIIYDRLGALNIKYLGDNNYAHLINFCRIYEDVLQAYDTMAKLKKPEEQVGILTRLLDLYQKILAQHGQQPQNDPIYTYFKNEFLNVANDKTAGSVAMVCTNACNKLIHPPFNYLFQPGGTWNWKQMIDEGKVVVMDMSRAMYTAAAEIGYILMKTDYFRTVLGRKTLTLIDPKTGQKRGMNMDRELLYMVDEFQAAVTTGKETGEAGFLDRAREYKGTCVLATQGNSMLTKSITRDEMLAIYTNLQTKVFFANDEPETCKYISDIGGLKNWVNGTFNDTAEQRAFNTRELGATGASFGVNMSARYVQADIAKLVAGEAILKLPARFGKAKIIMQSKLELELLLDETPDIPVPKCMEPLTQMVQAGPGGPPTVDSTPPPPEATPPPMEPPPPADETSEPRPDAPAEIKLAA